MNEEILKLAGTIFIAAITASTVTNLIIKRRKNAKLNDVKFTADDDFLNDDDLFDEEEQPAANFMNQPQVDPVTINVDQNGNVVTPVRFQAQNMVINPEAAPVM